MKTRRADPRVSVKYGKYLCENIAFRIFFSWGMFKLSAFLREKITKTEGPIVMINEPKIPETQSRTS